MKEVKLYQVKPFEARENKRERVSHIIDYFLIWKCIVL